METGILTVCVGDYTLEADLFGQAANDPLLRKAWKEIHSRSEAKWDAVITATGGDEARRAECFRQAMRDDELDIGKGDFAQIVADALEAQAGEVFIVPSYLAAAINAVLLPTAEDSPEEIILPINGGDNEG